MIMLIGFVCMLFFFGLNIIFLGSLDFARAFMDFPSLVTVLAPLAFFLPVTGAGKAIAVYLRKSLLQEPRYTASELSALSSAIGGTIKTLLGVSAAVALTCFIFVLMRLSDPSSLGPGVSMCMLSMLYAALLCVFVLYPTKFWADNLLKKDNGGM